MEPGQAVEYLDEHGWQGGYEYLGPVEWDSENRCRIRGVLAGGRHYDRIVDTETRNVREQAQTAQAPSAGAMRAAKIIVAMEEEPVDPQWRLAQIIDTATALPELLAAAEKAVAACEDCGGQGWDCQGQDDQKVGCTTCAGLRSALAKARREGE